MSPRALGTATTAVLQAVADGRRYGFAIIESTGLASGTVYPALSTLTRRSLVRARWEDAEQARADGRPRRRYYEVTTAGEGALREARARLRALGLAAPSPAPESA